MSGVSKATSAEKPQPRLPTGTATGAVQAEGRLNLHELADLQIALDQWAEQHGEAAATHATSILRKAREDGVLSVTIRWDGPLPDLRECPRFEVKRAPKGAMQQTQSQPPRTFKPLAAHNPDPDARRAHAAQNIKAMHGAWQISQNQKSPPDVDDELQLIYECFDKHEDAFGANAQSPVMGEMLQLGARACELLLLKEASSTGVAMKGLSISFKGDDGELVLTGPGKKLEVGEITTVKYDGFIALMKEWTHALQERCDSQWKKNIVFSPFAKDLAVFSSYVEEFKPFQLRVMADHLGWDRTKIDKHLAGRTNAQILSEVNRVLHWNLVVSQLIQAYVDGPESGPAQAELVAYAHGLTDQLISRSGLGASAAQLQEAAIATLDAYREACRASDTAQWVQVVRLGLVRAEPKLREHLPVDQHFALDRLIDREWGGVMTAQEKSAMERALLFKERNRLLAERAALIEERKRLIGEG